jgi:mono/diheme cytochrome c family protein
LNDLDKPLQEAVVEQLATRCGTPGHVKLLSDPDVSAQTLARGAAVYSYYCVQCHGVTGDGAGPAAAYLNPKPRDYRKGIFKFTSTGYGNKPRREDLLRTVRRGVIGTSMPSFDRLPHKDLEAVVDYVMALTQRGELETLLIAQAEGEGELSAEAADELAQAVVDGWSASAEQVVEPATKMPPYTPESVQAGQEIFQKRECYKCHGRDGRGGLAGGIEVGQDAWGQKAAAADLTSGMLHGGSQPIDIYRRIYAGINGTPMPAFKDVLAENPDDIWNLVHYVLYLSDQRRHGVQFALGTGNATASPGVPETTSQPETAEPAASERGENDG